ncbi:hypothetical protein EDC04DRAFT_2615578 [Pisolithus marmoratus]|nr:hypothetical protein EDC04DRAFT_2615578 [Pisolithus marmoratus]
MTHTHTKITIGGQTFEMLLRLHSLDNKGEVGKKSGGTLKTLGIFMSSPPIPPLIAHSVFSVGDGSSASGAARAKTPRMATPRATTPRAIAPRAKTPSATTPRAQTFGGQTPAPAGKQKLVTIENLPSDSEHSESSPAPSESSLSSLESEPGADDKIPKPSGEVGRPGHGGYNLEEQLGWGEDGFKRLKVSVY